MVHATVMRYKQGRTHIHSIPQGDVVTYPGRSYQMDAWRLDSELYNMLSSGLSSVASSSGPAVGAIMSKLQPEISALLGTIVFFIGAMRTGSTPGAALMNIRYAGKPAQNDGKTAGQPYSVPRGRLVALWFATVGVRYAWSRAVQWLAARGWASSQAENWQRTAWQHLRRAERLYAVVR